MFWDGIWLTGIEFQQHNSMAGLQGGQTGEYYHLTAAEYIEFGNIDTTYLKLDCSNDPLTGNLDLGNNDLLNPGAGHNSFTDLQGGQINEYYHLTASEYTDFGNIPTTYLQLDCSNDPLTGTLTSQTILPNGSATYDLGDLSNYYKTLYLSNDGGNVVLCQGVQSGGGPTTYTFNCGGGQFGGDLNQGGTFTFKMNDIASSLGTCINQLILDPGRPDVFAAGTTNDIIFQSFNGIATYGFVSAFGGFNDVQYGLELRRISGTEAFAKTLIFDNQVPNNDFRRSIDFRINSVNKLTIENDGTVAVIDRITTPELTAGVINNGVQFGTVAVPGVNFIAYGNFFGLNWFDYLTVNSVTSNLPVCLGMFPSGTATASYVNVYNSSSTGAAAWLSMGARGSTAELVIRDFSQTTNITTMNIGSGGNDFPVFDLTCTTLTDINFIFAGLTEMTIQPNTIVFNNGAVDTQIDWTTSGELGFQVATNDIIRISAALAHIYQNTDIDGDLWLTSDNDKIYLGTGKDLDFYYDGTYAYLRTDLQNPSDLRLDCGTDKTLELQESVWDDYNAGALILFGPPGQNPATVEFLDNTGTGTGTYGKGIAVGEAVSGNFELEHGYKEGTNLKFHIHWQGNIAPTGTDNVQWELTYTVMQDGVTLSPSATITVETAYDTQYEGVISAMADITGTSYNIGDQFLFTIERIAASINEYGGVAVVATVGVHAEQNTMGSRQVFIK